MLYSLYTSPISNIIHSYGLSHHIYADDTSIFISYSCSDAPESLDILDACTLHLLDWFNVNRLRLNPDKSVVLVCPPRGNIVPNDVSLCGVPIPCSSVARYLGVNIDSFLTFDKHITDICQSSFACIRSLYRIRRYIDEQTAAQIIHAFIHTRLDYCNAIFAACSTRRIQRLQRIQNCCARLLKKLPRFTPTSPVLRELHWLPVRLRIDYKVCCFVHKCIYGSAPSYLSDLLHVAPAASSSMSLRSHDSLTLHQPIARSTLHGGSFSVHGPRLWNSLSASCRNERDFDKFRCLLKTELFLRF